MRRARILSGLSSTAPVTCFYYCNRGDVANAPVAKVIEGSNSQHFVPARATLLAKPTEELSVTTTLMYQRIHAAGYAVSGCGRTIHQPYDQPELAALLAKCVM